LTTLYVYVLGDPVHVSTIEWEGAARVPPKAHVCVHVPKLPQRVVYDDVVAVNAVTVIHAGVLRAEETWQSASGCKTQTHNRKHNSE
jgi:hypothetical protein